MFAVRLILFYGLVFSQTIFGLNPGDVCTIERTSGQGTCKHLTKCPTVISGGRKQKPPTVCGFEEEQQIVCCPDPIQKITRTKRNTNEYLLSQTKCQEYSEKIGQCDHESDQLILNEEQAHPKEFPQTALIGYETDGNVTWSCVGILISHEYILTNARCITSPTRVPKYIRIGDLNIESDKDDAKPETFNVSQIIPHPDFTTPALLYNDIGLLRMDRKVKFSQYIRPACLATTSDSPGTEAIVSGWEGLEGKPSSHMLKFRISKLNHSECNELLKDLRTRRIPDGIQEKSQICGKSAILGRSLCNGSSGAPLQVDHSSLPCMRTVIGVSSFNVPCGGTFPFVYTKVFPYVDWIESVIWKK